MTHFLAFLGPKSPKCGPVLLKFAPQLLTKESKTLFEEFFENSNFYRNRAIQKSQSQGPILPQFFMKNVITFCPILALFW